MGIDQRRLAGFSQFRLSAVDFGVLGTSLWAGRKDAMAKFECLVAELDGQPVGCALICRGFEAHAGRRLWLGDLYVRKAARLSGAGRLAAVARRALYLDCEALYPRGGLYSPFFPFFHLEKREQLATVARTALGTSAF